MAFVAHARPEAPKWLRQGESFDPAPRGKSDTHACSLNKGIGCKSRTRKESIAGLQSVHLRLQARGRVPKVAVILKYCFPCGKSPRAVKTGHWKGCHGPERRLKQCVCAKKRTRSQRLQGFTRMNGSVRRPTKSKTEDTQAPRQEAVMLKRYQRICIAKICHRSDDWRNHRFCCFCGSLSLR